MKVAFFILISLVFIFLAKESLIIGNEPLVSGNEIHGDDCYKFVLILLVIEVRLFSVTLMLVIFYAYQFKIAIQQIVQFKL